MDDLLLEKINLDEKFYGAGRCEICLCFPGDRWEDCQVVECACHEPRTREDHHGA